MHTPLLLDPLGALVALPETAERAAIVTRLEALGFQVWTALNSQAAMDIYLTHTGDIDLF